MRETCNTSGVSRRAVLLATARADGGPLSDQPEGRPPVRRLQLLHGAERLQAGRRRHRADRLVCSVGQEGPCLNRSAVTALFPEGGDFAAYAKERRGASHFKDNPTRS
jgi:hypothetical protein